MSAFSPPGRQGCSLAIDAKTHLSHFGKFEMAQKTKVGNARQTDATLLEHITAGKQCISRRSAMGSAALMLSVGLAPQSSAEVKKADTAGADEELILMAERCIQLDVRLVELMHADTKEEGSAAIDRTEAEIEDLALKVRSARAHTMAGIIAKARLYERLMDEDGDGDDVRMYPLDPEFLAYSVCRDVLSLASSTSQPPNS